MSCSVIIVSYHTGPMLFASIKSVMQQEGLADLIIVDNGNPPDVFSRLQQMSLGDPRIRIIHGQGNIGYAKACNLAANQATGEYLLFLNPDCLLSPNVLTTLTGAMNVPHVVMATGQLLRPNGAPCRSLPLLTPKTALKGAFGWYWLKKLLRNTREATAQTPYKVPYVSSACMCIRRSDFMRFSGFDDHFFLYVEDFDLCMRVYKAGGDMLCVPSVHVTRMRSRKETRTRLEWQKTKGYIHYFNKHFKGVYFPGLLLLINAGIFARFAIKNGMFGLLGMLKEKPLMTQSAAARRLMLLATGLADLPAQEDLAGKTVLVTGATGHVGLCVIRRLIASGAAVLGLSRGDGVPFEHPQLRWLKGDLADPKLNLQGYFIDIVVHCAPLWFLPPALDLLADAEVQRIIAFSSTSVFARALSHNRYDKDIVEKFTHAETEIAERCTARSIYWTIFRPTLIYGVGLDQNVTTLAKFIWRFGWFPVYPPAFGRRQPVHADDLAIGVLQALLQETTYGKSYNVSGGEVLTYRDMLERIFKLLGKKIQIPKTTLLPFLLDVMGLILHKPHVNGEVARRMNDDLVFFHDEAKRDFGFHPRGFLTGGMRDIRGV